MPVFAQFKGGLGVFLGPTGGYLLSYPIAAAVAGLAAPTPRESAARRRALLTSLLWGCAGLAVIYALGATWLAVVTRLPIAAALAQGVAAVRVLRPDKGGPRRARGRRRRPRHSRFADLIVEREAPRRVS